MFIDRGIVPNYKDLLQNPDVSDPFIEEVFAICERQGYINWLLQELERESSTDQSLAYPGMGLVFTGYEGDRTEAPESDLISNDLRNQSVWASIYYSILNNHPDRIEALFAQSEQEFVPPQQFEHPFFNTYFENRWAINIADIKLAVQGDDKPRQSRTELHQNGPFVSYSHPGSEGSKGRQQARGVIVVGENPYATGSPFALAKIAENNFIAGVPRDGYFSKISRQRDLFKKALEFLENSPIFYAYDKTKAEKEKLLDFYRRNLAITLEPESGKALKRAKELYAAGARTFRIYSPEPGNDIVNTLKNLRQLEKDEDWEPIEIFVGQVISVEQAIALEQAGADAIYVGIGGGGRCITGVVGGLTINWPELVWKLRGKVNIPVIVQGGANDYIAESLAVGASGIGAVGKITGTIETPGGLRYFKDEKSGFFRYYGGEASNSMRAMAGRVGPMGFIYNTEGETTRRRIRHDAIRLPVLPQALHELSQGIVAAFVFQNVNSLPEFHAQAPKTIRRASPNDDASRNTHNV